MVCATLGRNAEALAAHEQALDERPDQIAWHVDYARLLRDQVRLNDSRRELSLILGNQPGNTEARILLEGVEHDIAAGQ